MRRIRSSTAALGYKWTVHAATVLLAQRSSSGAGAAAGLGFFFVFFGVIMAISVAIYVFYSFCLARVFRKAGLTEWWAWVPFVQQYGMWKLTNRDELWLILLFVPYANYVAMVVIGLDIAWSFRKSQGYGWGLGLLGIVFFPMLAFDDSTYIGPAPADAMPWNRPSPPPGWGQPYGGYGYGDYGGYGGDPAAGWANPAPPPGPTSGPQPPAAPAADPPAEPPPPS